jgi:3-isopropylmalate/(R)-2-methylmalate dehydratase small subunit
VRRDPVVHFAGRTAVLAADDVDTDQIIPARFLKGTRRDGLGAHLFADRPDAPLGTGAAVLVAGRNFGCGSSREHAVWALMDHGFRAVVAPSFADIFFSNALQNGLVPVVAAPSVCAQLSATPGAAVTVDVEGLRIALPDASTVAFTLPHFARHCLLEGLDDLQFLLSQEPLVSAYEAKGGAASSFAEKVTP